MLLSSYWKDNGVPATGLTPTVDVWNSGGTKVVDAQSMTEVGGGWYFYDFASYVEGVPYFIRADGGSGLSDTDRYSVSVPEQGEVLGRLTEQDGNLELILGLVQSNFKISGQSYDASGNLAAATITIYPTAADLDGDTNAIASYSVAASYTNDLMTSYTVKKN